MAANFEHEKRLRSVVRTSFTKTSKKIDDLLKDGKDVEQLVALMEVLELRFEELNKSNSIIQDLMIKNDAEGTELEYEQDKIDEYVLTFYKHKLAVSKLKNVEDASSVCSFSSDTSTSNMNCKYKLPQLKLKEFDGELRNWLPFWSQFKKIDTDPKLDPSDKFQYLIMATKVGTIAREVVDSYPATSDMYPEVIKALHERFGRKDLLTEYYIRELLGIIIQNTNSVNKMPVSVLYDKLQCHLRNLETLGVTSENYAPILLPLVSSCLPEDMIKIWERDSSNFLKRSNPGATSKDFLDNLIQFLRIEVEGEQKVTLAISGFGSSHNDSHPKIGERKGESKTTISHVGLPDFPTAAGLLTTSKNGKGSCIFCSSNHNSQDCRKAQTMTVSERRNIVANKRVCFCCLRPNHTAKGCKNRPKCVICGKSHYVLLCNVLPGDKIGDVKSHAPSKQSPQTVHKDETLTSLVNNCNVFMQTLVVVVRGNNHTRQARALIDSASQHTYILSSLAKEMAYVPHGKELIQHSLFGGINTGIIEHNVFTVRLSNINNDYNCNFNAWSQDRICSVISPVVKGPWLQELYNDGIELSDVGSPSPIEILIGADIAGKLLTGNVRQLSSGLVGIETKLGWTLMGKVTASQPRKENIAMVVTSMFVKEASLTDLWSLDTLGILDPSDKICKAEVEAATQQHFLDTVKVTNEGRFEVHLPWIADHPPLPSNYQLALKRLQCTVRKLKNDGFYDAYQNVLGEWLAEGVIEEVSGSNMHSPGHYLPHRHVVKLNSTTPVRPVFDASARENRNPSLNQCLEKGPNLIEKIPAVLARFRSKQFGVVGDIRRAFLQINVHESDRDYLRFLWIDCYGVLKVYRHCRVVFGVSPSPFLLEACINFHLENTLSLCREGKSKWPTKLVDQLVHSFYVDNCVTSMDSEEQALSFVEVASEVMKERHFELRGWEISQISPHSSPLINVLGILWDCTNDTLSFNIDSLQTICVDRVTKKVMLSAAHRLFDPIGVTCSVALIPKLLLQQTWELGLQWDQEVSQEIRDQFLKWLKEIKHLSELKFPRWITGCETSSENLSLHIFSDACKTSYAAVVFLRVEQNGSVNVQLVTAKTRVAPLGKASKRMTIPRLELLAASIASRMYATMIQDFCFQNIKATFWTDASTVLAWIQRKEMWDVFVSNRVKEIRDLTVGHEWKHIPGAENPADLPSRGCSAKKLVQSRWWEGPSWLKEPSNLWPCSEVSYNEIEIQSEMKKPILSTMLCEVTDKSWYYRYFSQFKKLVRMISWIYRFKRNAGIEESQRIHQDLTAEEYSSAEKKVIQLIQEETFSGVFDPKLSSLFPFMDDGMIRLMTKVSNREDINEFCHPLVLPSAEHPVVHSLIMDIHRSNCHVGTQMIMSILRKQYWILGGRRTVRSVINSCLRCKRHSAKKVEAKPTPLPESRVRNARIFEITGVDLAGPLFIKEGEGSTKKFWICLFTCGVYRAIHLELVSSQSTDSFLQALRRFVSRRGRPQIVYSDQGTNFVGANNALVKLDWKVIMQYSSVRKIEWRFNPPASPWWGGFWERLIGILKGLLRRVLGRSSVTYEEMLTILCDCESVINARPLTYISQDSNDLAPITPSMFLQDVEEVGLPDLDLVEASDLNRRLQYRLQLKETLRERFRVEYLGQLKLFANEGEKRELGLGEIVLVGSDDSKRLDWPLGRIIELIKGNDDHIRVVRIKTAHGELVRPVQRVYPLELDIKPSEHSQIIGDQLRRQTSRDDVQNTSNQDTKTSTLGASPGGSMVDPGQLASSSVRVTRSGRRVNNPERLDL